MEVELRSLKRDSDTENEPGGAAARRKRGNSGAGSSVAHSDISAWLASHNLPASTQVLTYWHSVAELNVLLRCFSHTFGDLVVHEERSFSRCSPETTLDQLASALGLGAASSPGASSNPWLCAAGVVLGACNAAACDGVAASLLEVSTPRFAAAWASKWAGGAGRLRLMQLQFYRPGPAVLRASTVYNLGGAPATTVAPERTIFLPQL